MRGVALVVEDVLRPKDRAWLIQAIPGSACPPLYLEGACPPLYLEGADPAVRLGRGAGVGSQALHFQIPLLRPDN